jgi:hypothetical protein
MECEHLGGAAGPFGQVTLASKYVVVGAPKPTP